MGVSMTPVNGGWVYNPPIMPSMQFKFDEGRVYGARYYTVKIDFAGEKWFDMEKWCEETMGPTTEDGVWTPSQRWYVNNQMFWFRTEADRNWFVLRWS